LKIVVHGYATVAKRSKVSLLPVGTVERKEGQHKSSDTPPTQQAFSKAAVQLGIGFRMPPRAEEFPD
jgi:hypothetical protein